VKVESLRPTVANPRLYPRKSSDRYAHVVLRLPPVPRALLVCVSQPVICLLNRIDSPTGPANDACVFVAVARKQATSPRQPSSEAGGTNYLGRSAPSSTDNGRLRGNVAVGGNHSEVSATVLHPSPRAHSESFIQAYLARFPCRVRVLSKGWLPTQAGDGFPLLGPMGRLIGLEFRQLGFGQVHDLSLVRARKRTRNQVDVALAEF
jgi:hypothetical protein